MNKQELIRELAKRSDLTQTSVREVLDAFIEEVIRTLEAGDSYNQPGFGTFRTETTNPRVGYNPAVGKRMLYPEKRKVVFRPSAGLKRLINE